MAAVPLGTGTSAHRRLRFLCAASGIRSALDNSGAVTPAACAGNQPSLVRMDGVREYYLVGAGSMYLFALRLCNTVLQ